MTIRLCWNWVADVENIPVGLARRYPDKNFIGVDIKGARMWTGATEALNEGLKNAAFLRTNIEIIDRFFAPGRGE